MAAHARPVLLSADDSAPGPGSPRRRAPRRAPSGRCPRAVEDVRWRVADPPPSSVALSACRSILRRCPNAASMRANVATRSASVPGSSARPLERHQDRVDVRHRPEHLAAHGAGRAPAPVPGRLRARASRRPSTPAAPRCADRPRPAPSRARCCRLGTVASRCRMTGTDTLYGRFATSRLGVPGSAASTRSASSCSTVSGAPGHELGDRQRRAAPPGGRRSRRP